MNRRINLFRQVLKSSVGATASPRKSFKLDRRLAIAGGAAFLFVIGVVPDYYKTQRRALDHHVRSLEMEAQIVQFTVEAEEKAKQIAEKRKQDKERLAQGKTSNTVSRTPSSMPSPGLNETWTSILWKLTTFTPPQIVIDKMDLTKGAGASTEGSTIVRQASLEGQATSLAALQRWLEGISLNLPNSDFLLDRQQTGTGAYPISFRVTARFI